MSNQTNMKKLHMLHTLDTNVGELGVTIRRGLKWYNDDNEFLELCVCVPKCEIKGVGKVEFREKFLFKDIPARYLEYEHESRSRLYSGCLESMKKAYGENFTEDTEVTVLGYTRIK